ncbi:MAG: ABC-F family ATP-binding cassette domain-containing protein [Planctomycetales bacterium]|nr:ABC-F family ATP-binding cassette domain-containing protein [Planctomycetales bacterium]
MPLAQLESVAKAFGAQRVLEGASMEVDEDERVGLIGANGSGKTSILRLLAGEIEPEAGNVVRRKGLRVGYLPQVPDFAPGNDVLSEALRVFDEVRRIETRLRALEHEMAAPRDDAHLRSLLSEHGRLQEDYDRREGWRTEGLAEAALMGLGLGAADLGKDVGALSGGEKNRLALAKVLLARPDLLLLDEPTNFLDLAATEWLEEFLLGAREALLLVTHDRRLLDRVATRIVEVERGRCASYPGNFSAYAVQKAERTLAARRAYEKQKAWLDHQEEYIRRSIGGQDGYVAYGRRKRLERVERLEAPREEREVSLSLGQGATQSGFLVLETTDFAKSLGGRELFSGLSLRLERSERLGIVGPNGSGKTTLLRILRGDLAPDAGSFRFGANVAMAVYDQEHRDLDLGATGIENIRAVAPRWAEEQVRSWLGRFLLGEDLAEKAASALSGGERSRLALARMIVSPANLLLLDEPTNHLDVSARGALEEALEDWPGTLVVVSHDRFLLDRLATRLLLLGPGGPRLFPGNWSEWVEKRRAEERAKAPKAPAPPAARSARAPKSPPKPPPGKPARKRRPVEAIEKEIIAREEAIARLHAEMALEENCRDGEKMRALKSELDAAQAALRNLEWEWGEQAR